jgi:hypothetical protein
MVISMPLVTHGSNTFLTGLIAPASLPPAALPDVHSFCRVLWRFVPVDSSCIGFISTLR